MEEAGTSKQERKPQRSRASSQGLEQRIADISRLGSAALVESWKAVFRSPPPSNFSRNFLIRALAFRIQEKTLGGLKPSTLRILDRVLEGNSSLESQRAATRRPAPGTVLIRQWHGVTHRVLVLDKDVVYQGQRYKSLTEVASLITGTHWSGPMFFGLRNRKKEMANG